MTDIAIRQLDPRPAAAVRLSVPMAELDLGALFDEHLPNIAHRLADLGIEPGGAPYGRYHEFGPENVTAEIGIPTTAPVSTLRAIAAAADGELAASELPGGEAAVAVHRGPYDTLPQAYEAVQSWITDHGRAVGGAPWESYVDDPSEVPVDELRTEIVFPLA